MINNILAKIEANLAGVDDALMLDIDGFVSETNATNVFYIKNKKLMTPFPDSCLPGITRQLVMDIANDLKIENHEKRCSLVEFYTAEEVFTTGTMGELSYVSEIDGRKIGKGAKGGFTILLENEYLKRTKNSGINID